MEILSSCRKVLACWSATHLGWFHLQAGPSIEVVKERMVDYSRVERFAGTTRKRMETRETALLYNKKNGQSEYQVASLQCLKRRNISQSCASIFINCKQHDSDCDYHVLHKIGLHLLYDCWWIYDWWCRVLKAHVYIVIIGMITHSICTQTCPST